MFLMKLKHFIHDKNSSDVVLYLAAISDNKLEFNKSNIITSLLIAISNATKF